MAFEPLLVHAWVVYLPPDIAHIIQPPEHKMLQFRHKVHVAIIQPDCHLHIVGVVGVRLEHLTGATDEELRAIIREDRKRDFFRDKRGC